MKKFTLFLMCGVMLFSSLPAFASEFNASKRDSEKVGKITYASEQEDYDEQGYLSSMMARGAVMSGDNGETKYPQYKNQPIGEMREQYLEEKMMEQRQRAMVDEYETISVPVFEQINSYYCGPATVKQVSHFINGRSDDQDEIAEYLGTTRSGTDMTVILDVLNDLYADGWYIYADIGSFNTWFHKVSFSVDEEMPAILDIDTRDVDAFPYSSSGHFVNISGYDVYDADDIHRVRITDPWGPGLGNKWYESDDLYQANSDHFRSAIIW